MEGNRPGEERIELVISIETNGFMIDCVHSPLNGQSDNIAKILKDNFIAIETEMI